MPWSSSNRKRRFNPGWQRIRKQVLARDGYKCQWPVEDSRGFPMGVCGEPANAVDHKHQNMVRDDDSMGALWALCDRHHNLKTQVESAQGKRRRAANRRFDSFYDHPAFR